MEWAYAAADIAISRCGAMTLAEIAMAGLPSILIPYPHAADGHQSANATVFEREGAAIVWEEARLWAGALSAIVRDLKGNPSALGAMADAAKALAVPDAAERLAGLIEETMHLGRAV
jgi:UDP-N-acetylglucosamine--N-acetylmuramyl-(pentapeptide) pyrophosphoryl-undecaprenol N-acetylglucosamine transferase